MFDISGRTGRVGKVSFVAIVLITVDILQKKLPKKLTASGRSS
jgi:hypothetical protein